MSVSTVVCNMRLGLLRASVLARLSLPVIANGIQPQKGFHEPMIRRAGGIAPTTVSETSFLVLLEVVFA